MMTIIEIFPVITSGIFETIFMLSVRDLPTDILIEMDVSSLLLE